MSRAAPASLPRWFTFVSADQGPWARAFNFLTCSDYKPEHQSAFHQ